MDKAVATQQGPLNFWYACARSMFGTASADAWPADSQWTPHQHRLAGLVIAACGKILGDGVFKVTTIDGVDVRAYGKLLETTGEMLMENAQRYAATLHYVNHAVVLYTPLEIVKEACARAFNICGEMCVYHSYYGDTFAELVRCDTPVASNRALDAVHAQVDQWVSDLTHVGALTGPMPQKMLYTIFEIELNPDSMDWSMPPTAEHLPRFYGIP